MTPFLNLTRYDPKADDGIGDEGAPFLVNPAQIVTIGRVEDYITAISLSNGGAVRVCESVAQIMDMLDSRSETIALRAVAA